MKHKTSELTGDLLDAAVAKAMGILVTPDDDHPQQPGLCESLRKEWGCHVVRWFAADDDGNETSEEGGWEPITSWGGPSTNWEDGGPIIDRERISLIAPALGTSKWVAGINAMLSHREAIEMEHQQKGETALIAAMRCFVASKMGDEVEL